MVAKGVLVVIVLVGVAVGVVSNELDLDLSPLPSGFLLGTASSSYQVFSITKSNFATFNIIISYIIIFDSMKELTRVMAKGWATGITSLTEQVFNFYLYKSILLFYYVSFSTLTMSICRYICNNRWGKWGYCQWSLSSLPGITPSPPLFSLPLS